MFEIQRRKGLAFRDSLWIFAVATIFLIGGTRAFAFQVGDRVKCTTNGTNVRSGPGTNYGTIPGSPINSGALGVIKGGPTVVNPYTWYSIRWDGFSQDGYTATINYVAVVPDKPTSIAPGNGISPGPTLTTLYPTLQWNAVLGVQSYNVYIRDLDTNQLESFMGATTGLSWTAPFDAIQPGHNYRWNVSASDSAGEGTASDVRYFVVASLPVAPSGLASAVNDGLVALAWNDNSSNEDQFKVERLTPNGSWTQIATVSANVSSYRDTAVTNGVTYSYRVRASNGVGDSAYSNTVTATPAVAVPFPPTNLGAYVSGLSVQLAWNDNSNNETGFEVQRSVGGGAFAQLALVGASTGDAVYYTDQNVVAGTTYGYRVRAYNAGGYSTFTDTVSVTTSSDYTLNVASLNPASGVNVNVYVGSTYFVSGSTPTSGNFASGTTVGVSCASTLTSGNAFQKWQLDGADYSTSNNTSVTMTSGHTLTAIYVAPPSQLADVTVFGVPQVAPDPVAPGATLQVTYVDFNQGGSSAGPSQTKIQIKNSSGVLIASSVASVPAVPAGASSTFNQNVSIPAAASPGPYIAYVILDNQSEIAQSNYGNDSSKGAAFQIGGPGAPDLAFQVQPSVAEVSTLSRLGGRTPAAVVDGQSLTVTYDVINKGSVSADSSFTSLSLATLGGHVVAVTAGSTPAILPGQTVHQTNSFVVPSGIPAGIYSLQVALDTGVPGLKQSDKLNDYSTKFIFSIQNLTDPLPPTGGPVEGFDFNATEKSPDWTNIPAQMRFVYLKCTEANYVTDGTLQQNIAGANMAKLAIGGYHFGTPLFSSPYYDPSYRTHTSAVEEAAHFFDTAKSIIGPGFLMPALDIEDQIVKQVNGSYVYVNLLTGESYKVVNGQQVALPEKYTPLTPKQLADWIEAWVATFENLSAGKGGVKPILYLSGYYADNLYPFLGSKLNFWVVDLNPSAKGKPNTHGWNSWAVQQYSFAGQAGGINVDLDVLPGSLDGILVPPFVFGSRGRILFVGPDFHVEVAGNDSELVQIQASSDATQWSDVGAVQLVNGHGEFIDSTANSTPTRLYRVKP